jgi:hypothetical protein
MDEKEAFVAGLVLEALVQTRGRYEGLKKRPGSDSVKLSVEPAHHLIRGVAERFGGSRRRAERGGGIA